MIVTIDPQQIETLAPMSPSIAQLAGIVGDRDASVTDIANVVRLDPAMTTNVLRLANSAWSGSARRIETVQDAVIRLGAGRVLELLVGQRVVKAMSQRMDGYALGERELWRHSVAAALAVERLGTFASQPIPGAAFTAALIHDIGKLLLNRYLCADAIRQIRDIVQSEHVAYLEAERRILGTDHAEVGGAVAHYWKFPAPLVEAIAHHHNPDIEPSPTLDAVHIANAAAKLIGLGLGIEEMNMQASAEAGSRLGLSSSGLESLCAAVKADLAEAEKIWESSSHGT